MANTRESSLRTQNITIRGRRTSVRLEQSMQAALQEACDREGITIHEFCARAQGRYGELRLTAAIRASLVDYFRSALRRLEERDH